MIQRRVKWKKGVAVENGCVQAEKGLGNGRKAGDGGVGKGGRGMLLSISRLGGATQPSG